MTLHSAQDIQIFHSHEYRWWCPLSLLGEHAHRKSHFYMYTHLRNTKYNSLVPDWYTVVMATPLSKDTATTVKSAPPPPITFLLVRTSETFSFFPLDYPLPLFSHCRFATSELYSSIITLYDHSFIHHPFRTYCTSETASFIFPS